MWVIDMQLLQFDNIMIKRGVVGVYTHHANIFLKKLTKRPRWTLDKTFSSSVNLLKNQLLQFIQIYIIIRLLTSKQSL